MDKNDADVIFARFIRYMQKALINRRIDYIKMLNKIKDNEEELNDESNISISIDESSFINLDILSEKEKELLDMLYNKGFSYKDISLKNNEKIKTLELRRYRAIKKLKEKKGDT